MNERFTPASSHEKTVPVRGTKEINADLARLNSQAAQLGETLEPLMEKAEEYQGAERDIIQSFMAKLSVRGLTAADFAVPKDAPEAFRPFLEELAEGLKKAHAHGERERELQAEYLPHLIEDLRVRIEDLAGRVDYDAVFEHFSNSRKGGGYASNLVFGNVVNELFALRSYARRIQEPSEDPVADYYYLSSAAEGLKEWGGRWESHGFLKGTASEGAGSLEAIARPGTPEDRENLTKTLRVAWEDLKKYAKLSGTYRTFDSRARERPNWWLAELSRGLSGSDSYFGLEKEFEKLDFDPAFVAAAKRHADGILTEYRRLGRLPKTDVELVDMRDSIESIPSVELVAALPIQGFEAPPGTKLLIDADELRAWLEHLPPEFCEGLLSISHRPPRPKSPDQPNIETAGTFSPVYGFGEDWDTVVAKQIEVYLPVAIPESATESQANIAKMELLETIWHEFGHNAHHMLDFEEMTVWEEVILDDRTAPTWYVKSSREKNEATGKREDFAESFMMYQSDPALLYKLSPSRYQFMSEFFDRRLQESQKQKFNNRRDDLIQAALVFWEEKGMSDEDIRKAYAPHEHATGGEK